MAGFDDGATGAGGSEEVGAAPSVVGGITISTAGGAARWAASSSSANVERAAGRGETGDSAEGAGTGGGSAGTGSAGEAASSGTKEGVVGRGAGGTGGRSGPAPPSSACSSWSSDSKMRGSSPLSSVMITGTWRCLAKRRIRCQDIRNRFNAHLNTDEAGKQGRNDATRRLTARGKRGTVHGRRRRENRVRAPIQPKHSSKTS